MLLQGLYNLLLYANFITSETFNPSKLYINNIKITTKVTTWIIGAKKNNPISKACGIPSLSQVFINFPEYLFIHCIVPTDQRLRCFHDA